MNGELLYTKNPRHFRIAWGIFYVVVIIFLFAGLYIAATRIRTHSLPVGEVQLSVPYSKYVVGETVTFTITNKFNSTIYITNNCPAEPLNVFRQENNQWIRIHDQASDSVCSDENRQVGVPSKGSVNGSFANWPHLFNQPGKYRIAAFIENYNAIPYQEFEMIAKPAPKQVSSTTKQAPTTPVSPNPSSNIGTQRSAVPSPAPIPGIASPPSNTRKSRVITTSRGSLTVQYDSTTVYVISILPAANCTSQGGSSGVQVQITFKCGNGETQIQLSVQNGQLIQNIEQSNGDD